MTEREKVIKGLKGIYRCISPVNHTCGDCPYQDNYAACIRRVVSDAIALLKEQETTNGHWIPVKSPTGVKEMTNVRCSVCNAEEDVSFSVYKFCPRCGAKMERVAEMGITIHKYLI